MGSRLKASTNAAARENARRAAGRGGVGAGGEGSGSIPWYVPEGAEWDYEQAAGYWGGGDIRIWVEADNPWYRVWDAAAELTDAERALGDAPWDELEDWPDLIPPRPVAHPVSNVFEDLAAAITPDAEVERLIAEAARTLDDGGDRVRPGRAALIEKPVRKARKRATKRRTPVRRAPAPPPAPEPVAEPTPELVLPTDAHGRIDLDAWTAFWAQRTETA